MDIKVKCKLLELGEIRTDGKGKKFCKALVSKNADVLNPFFYDDKVPSIEMKNYEGKEVALNCKLSLDGKYYVNGMEIVK